MRRFADKLQMFTQIALALSSLGMLYLTWKQYKENKEKENKAQLNNYLPYK